MRRLTHMAILAAVLLGTAVLSVTASTSPASAADPTYTVKDGDTLFGIAASLGYTGQEQVFTDLVVKMNGLGGPDRLSVGQVLKLPTPGASTASTGGAAPASSGSSSTGPSGTAVNVSQTTTTTTSGGGTYTVKDGDTLFGIAASLGYTGQEQTFTDLVVKLNNLSGPDQLSVGQVLKLPGNSGGGSQPAASTATASTATTTTSSQQQQTGSQQPAQQSNAPTYGTTPQQSVDALRASTLGTCADSGAPSCDYGSKDQLIIPSLTHGDPSRCGSTTLNAAVNVYDVRGDGAMGIPMADCDVVRENFYIFPGYGGYPGSGGTTVLAGHVDYHPHYMAVFWYLRDIKPGTQIQYVNKDGKTINYKVDWAQAITDPNYDWSQLAKAGSQEALVLITCDGIFNPDTHEYDHRFVAHAVRDN